MNEVIFTEGLRHNYNGKPALSGLSLQVEQGSICALLGSNGAGKSTLIRILAGLLKPSAGNARVLGLHPYAKAQELRSRVAYLPEKPKFFDWMTVSEAGWFASGFYPAGFESRYQATIERLKLDAGKKLSELSKGGYAKVGLALAMAQDPEILLLDEPTSGLDLFTRRDFLSGMVDLASQGKTVFISSHGVAEIERVASHAIFLDEGKVVLSGSLEEVKRRVRRLKTEGKPPAGQGEVLRQESEGPWTTTWFLNPSVEANGQPSGDILSLEEIYQVLLGEKEGKEVLT